MAAVKDREALETNIKAVREQLGNTDRMVARSLRLTSLSVGRLGGLNAVVLPCLS